MVRIAFDNPPVLLLGVLTAKPYLILDRSVALIVGGIAGVDRDTGHRRHSFGRVFDDRRLSFAAS